jgi:hypothetical protein
VGGAAATPLAKPTAPYLCANFTAGASTASRATEGASITTQPAAQFSLGWDGGNAYPACSSQQYLLCACW